MLGPKLLVNNQNSNNAISKYKFIVLLDLNKRKKCHCTLAPPFDEGIMKSVSTHYTAVLVMDEKLH